MSNRFALVIFLLWWNVGVSFIVEMSQYKQLCYLGIRALELGKHSSMLLPLPLQGLPAQHYNYAASASLSFEIARLQLRFHLLTHDRRISQYRLKVKYHENRFLSFHACAYWLLRRYWSLPQRREIYSRVIDKYYIPEMFYLCHLGGQGHIRTQYFIAVSTSYLTAYYDSQILVFALIHF